MKYLVTVFIVVQMAYCDARLGKAIELIVSGNEKEAKPLLKILLKENPENPMALYYTGLIFDKQGTDDSALFYYARTWQNPQADTSIMVDALYKSAHIHGDREEFERAVFLAARATQYVFPHAASNLIKDIITFLTGSSRRDALELGKAGLASIRKKKFKAGRKYFQEAVKLDSAWLGGYYELSIVCYEMGQYKKSLEYLERVLGKIPYHANAHFEKALCYEKLKMKEQALSHYYSYLKYSSRLNKASEKHAIRFVKENGDSTQWDSLPILSLRKKTLPKSPPKADSAGQKGKPVSPLENKEFEEGYSLLYKGRYQQAFKIFTDLSVKEPLLGLGEYGKALIFSRKNSKIKTLQFLEKALKLNTGIKELARKEASLDKWRSLASFKKLLD
jgi:tetratricopeptide (TPR) repeat protein